ncbi:MAG: hypothetical protein WDN72_06120 [Alphaproteobacteria bacterium]
MQGKSPLQPSPEGGGKIIVRYALAAIKNVGAAAMEAIVAERNANGPFRDVYDFAARVDATVINRRQMEHLVMAGCVRFAAPQPPPAFRVDGHPPLHRTERDAGPPQFADQPVRR